MKFIELAGGAGGNVFVSVAAIAQIEEGASANESTLVLIGGTRHRLAVGASAVLEKLATAETWKTPPMLPRAVRAEPLVSS